MLLIAATAQVASAAPTAAGLYLIDTATGATAFAAANYYSGIATFDGTLGDYSVDISTTGITLARGEDPSLELDVSAAFAGAGATSLQVFYSDGVFAPTIGQYQLASTGPRSGGPVTSSAYVGSAFFATTTTLASSVDVSPSVVNGSGTLNDANNYYLTLEDLITGTETGVTSTFTVTAPEPSALALLLMALPGAALLRKKLSA